MTDKEIFSKATQLQAEKVAFCFITIVHSAGSTPRKIGAKMIICLDGVGYGTIGGGCVEKDIKGEALRLMVHKKKNKLIHVSLADELGTKSADVCGGNADVFIENLSPN